MHFWRNAKYICLHNNYRRYNEAVQDTWMKFELIVGSRFQSLVRLEKSGIEFIGKRYKGKK